LWHGSRLTNFVGILSQGLRIAPPEAPVTGYMFGKGVYFADMVTKSANYCHSHMSNNTGLLLICEVALGETNDLLYSDYNAGNLPNGKSSTKGCGGYAPDPSTYTELDGVTLPMGPGKQLNTGGSLMYNEYIVYDVNQIKMKYLVKCNFNSTY
jgi:poly [ADP-ribose] polymerase